MRDHPSAHNKASAKRLTIIKEMDSSKRERGKKFAAKLPQKITSKDERHNAEHRQYSAILSWRSWHIPHANAGRI